MSIWDTPTLRREIDKMQDALDMLCPGAVVQLEHDTGQAADIKCIKLPIPDTVGEHFLVRRVFGGWMSARVTRNGAEKPLVTSDPSFMRVLRGVVGHMLVWQDSKAAAMHVVTPASVLITDDDIQRLMAATDDAELSLLDIKEPTTPYGHLKCIVDSYTGPRGPETEAKRAIYAAALDEHRGREADFTHDDLNRVIAAASAAGA